MQILALKNEKAINNGKFPGERIRFLFLQRTGTDTIAMPEPPDPPRRHAAALSCSPIQPTKT